MRSTTRTRRTALRTAAVVTGAAAVMALPVGSAFADSPAVPEPQVLPGIEQPPVEPPVEPPVDPPVDPQIQPPVKPSEKPVEKPKPSVRAYVTTVKLADGSIAKVYKISDNHFEADILSGGTKLDTLVSKGGAATYGRNNGLHVVLQPNGTVTSWVEGSDKPKPKPEVKRESSVRLTMPDGRIAKLVDGPNGKRVHLSMPNGNALGTIDLKHPSVQNDGWTYKLVRDGKRVKFVVIDGRGGGNSWVYDFNGRLIEKYTVDTKRDTKRDAKRDTKRETGTADVAKDVAKPA
ncbi:hypothetical protein ACFXJJ_33130, partial [Streptomyces sp. NPDC059233]